MRRLSLGVSVALLLCVAVVPRAFPQLGDSGRPDRDGHERMVAELERVAERSATENIYTGTDLLAAERAELVDLPVDAEAAIRVRLGQLIGRDDLRLGRNQEAVDRLEAAYSLAGSDSVEEVFALAVANLRRAESENCVVHRDPMNCILPIQGGGIHRNQASARNAVRLLNKVLERQPNHLTARWLLNLAAMALGEYPDTVGEAFRIPPSRFESEAEFPRFPEVAATLGLDTISLSGGVIADDFNDDGWLDVVVSDWNPDGQLRYFQNGGDGTFADRTNDAGLIGLLGGLNLVQADYDNDGDLDILVLRGAWLEEAGRGYPNSLLRNDGQGRFRDVTWEAGLASEHFPTQTAAWADYDSDGDLDLYVGNEYYPSQLFRNDGAGKFRDVAREAGVTNDDFAKAVVWGDHDADGDPDLYVSNFGGPNRLYVNQGDGTFADAAADLDVELPLKSFPAWFWDYNNDGILDLFVSGYEWNVADVAAEYFGLPARSTELDRLYRGDGEGGFTEAGSTTGAARITQPMGSNFGDIDNDGFLDYYLGTGYPAYEGLMPNRLFRNQAGDRFLDVTTAAGVGHLQKGHGVAFADFDHDGDLDLFVELGGAFLGDAYANAVFENPGFENRWLAVSLEGAESNRSAIGARIRADFSDRGERRSIYRWVNSGGSFGANPLRQHLGLGQAERVEMLEIHWPASGRTQRFHRVPVNRHIAIAEDASDYRTLTYRPWTRP